MIPANEAVQAMKATHDRAYKEAREKWVPYWMDKLDIAVANAAAHGRGEVRFDLQWSQKLGAARVPTHLVMEYTEKILDEELARDTGYYIIKLRDGTSTPSYRIVWYSEQYDAYKEARSHGIQEEENYPLPSLS